MRNGIRVTAVAVPVLSLCSAMADAATDLDAVQACSEAIATTIEERQGAEVGLRIDDSGINPRERLVGRVTVFDVNAIDVSTDKVIGRFSCRVDRRAQVTRLRTLKLAVPVAERRGRT